MNLNDKIKNYSSEVNSEDIWSAIEPRVKELNRKRRKRFFFWIFPILGIAAISLFLLRGETEHGDTVITNTLETTELNEPKLIKQNSDVLSPDENHQTVKSAEFTDTKENDIDTKSFNNEMKEIDKAANNKSSITNIESGGTTPSQSFLNEISGVQHNASSQNSKPEPIKTNYNHSQSSFPGLVPLTPFNVSSNSKSNIENSELEAINPQYRQEIASIDLFHQLNLIAISPNIDQHLQIDNAVKQPKKSFDIGLRLYGGASFVNRQMSASNSDWDDYLAIRESTETVLEATHFGADLIARHKSGFNVSMGIQRTQINERFDLNYSTTDTTTSTGIKYLVLNLMGDTTQVEGELQTLTTTSTRYQIYNKYRLIELPISIGYSYRKNNWAFGAQAGILLNLSLNVSGTILSDNGDIIELDDTSDIYRNSIGIGSFFGISVQRKLGKRFALSLNSNVKFYPNLYNSDYGLSSKYTLIGADLGVIYFL